ncbi:hypothetical protein SX4_3141 [Vibrio mimicus SX-4]|nr:hypothetical protein SX4_3141 [Vibrio mimicus SX-4]
MVNAVKALCLTAKSVWFIDGFLFRSEQSGYLDSLWPQALAEY